jgi:hypothetical protein
MNFSAAVVSGVLALGLPSLKKPPPNHITMGMISM